MVQKSSRKATPLARRANSTGNKHNLRDFKSLYLNVYIVLNYFLAFENKHFGCWTKRFDFTVWWNVFKINEKSYVSFGLTMRWFSFSKNQNFFGHFFWNFWKKPKQPKNAVLISLKIFLNVWKGKSVDPNERYVKNG